MSNLGKYPTLLEKELGRKLTRADRMQMREDYERAEQAYLEHLCKEIKQKGK